MSRHALALLALAVAASACAPRVRFEDRLILWRWPDDRPVPMPKKRELTVSRESVRDSVFAPADRVLSLNYFVEAQNTNALDEVPDSSWFHDRRRVVGEARPRHFPAEEMARGALGPDDTPLLPLTVIEGKNVGATPGFVALDARGVKYLVKLDPENMPGLNTSTEIVATRLAWAAGWLVPALSLIDARPTEVLLSPGATYKDGYGRKCPYPEWKLRALLDKVPRDAEGNMRLLASRWLPGVDIGEFAYAGRVRDDKNDLIDHQNRRDLRGFGIFASWINDVDTLQNNTLDMYQDGPPGQGHVVHYQQDLGGAFGNFAGKPEEFWMGTETFFEIHLIGASFLTLGLSPRGWHDARLRPYKDRLAYEWPELGNFEGTRFEPRKWRPILENAAFVRSTRRDRYWGAKQVTAFDVDEVRAAISAGRYRTAAAERLLTVLWERRQRIARAYYAEMSALDHFTLRGRTLCFDDLWIESGLGEAAVYHSNDGVVRDRCLAVSPQPGYRIIALTVQRPGERKPALPVRVHLMMAGDGGRIIGIER